MSTMQRGWQRGRAEADGTSGAGGASGADGGPDPDDVSGGAE
jgi:hypothetical protein